MEAYQDDLRVTKDGSTALLTYQYNNSRFNFAATPSVSGTLVSLVGHNHSGVYEPVITELPVSKGGTGRQTLTARRILYGDGTNDVALISDPSGNDGFLKWNDSVTAFEWVTNAMESHDINGALHTGTPLDVNKGGTGAASLADNALLIGNATSAIQTLSPATQGNLVYCNDATPPFSWTALTPSNGYLKSASGVLSWDALTAADIGAGTFSGAFTVTGLITLIGGAIVGNGGEYLSVRYTATEIHRANVGWNILQLGNNGPNYIVGGNTAANGYLAFYVNAATDQSISGATLALTLAATGDATFANHVEVSGQLWSEEEDHGSRSTATTVTANDSNAHYVYMTADFTITVQGLQDGSCMTVYVGASSAAERTITWSGVDDWATAEDNTVSPLETNVYFFQKVNGNVIGFVISQGIIGSLGA